MTKEDKNKGDHCAKTKGRSTLAHVNEGKAQHDGHFHEHGKAFDTPTNNEVLEDDTEKMAANHQAKDYIKTNPLKGFKEFAIDPETGFPICPKTKELIDCTKQ